MTKTILATLFVAVTLMIVATGLQQSYATPSTITVDGTTYKETTSESLVATFLQSDGGDTVNTYSGLVLLTVSGTGEASGTSDNDAFYVFENAVGGLITPFNHPNSYQVAFDESHIVTPPRTPEAFAVRNFIVFDVDAGTDVTPTYVPAYRADHIYTFVIDTGLETPSVLHFGVVDGNFNDNSGAFNIDVTQLKNNPCDALDKAQDNGKGKHKGIPKAKANNGCN